MTDAILGVLGGLGLFLLGMAIMTDGLKDLAGNALRNWLARFTSSPWTGAATGAVGTAILQSSSATTVMAVGFAGAGLLTFSQALGIIFGANLGTTITGWLVALLGFKLSLAKVVIPLVFLGAMLRLLGNSRIAAGGLALAGFGLIFVGISMLQVALEGAGDFVTPRSFPSDTLVGRLVLVGIGVCITLVTQSSSAGVATAITAVHVGTISLAQAAAMVIGMDIGTTFTAALASVGGTVSAKRTGVAHVVYNLMTGIGAFIMLPFFIAGWNWLASSVLNPDPEIALVSFHTLFNGLGVLLVLPWTNRFARLVEYLIPTQSNELTRRLEPTLLSQSSVAIAAASATLQELVTTVFESLSVLLTTDGEQSETLARLERAEQGISETRQYLSQIQTTPLVGEIQSAHSSALHNIDHLVRLVRRGRMLDRQAEVRADAAMRKLAHRLAKLLTKPIDDDPSRTARNQELERFWQQINLQMQPFRQTVIQKTGAGIEDTNRSIARLDAFRWLRRVSYHAWRISFHLDPTTDSTSEIPFHVAAFEDDPDARSANT